MHMRKHRRRALRGALLASAAFAGATALATGAVAQEAETGGATVGEIVVTAQKRAQNLQDVPIAVTAVTQDTLQANRVVNVMDLTGLAPGILARTNPGSLGSPSFSMRGIFASASQPSSDRQISVYLDGVYIGSTRGSVFDLPDLQRIEVLRGPQGTLFGRNATAGAVSVVTRDPTGEFHLRQEVTVGNYRQLRTRTTIDTPQMGPFSGYLTYVHDERRGDTRNLGAGTQFDRTSPFTGIGLTSSPKYLGSRNFENIFAVAKFAPVDNFSMVYKFDHSKGNNTPEARVTTAINPNSFIGAMLSQIVAAQPAGGGRYGPVTLDPSNKRLKAVNNAWTMPGYLTSYGHSLTTQWQINDSLSVKNISAYRHSTAYGPSTIAGLSGLEYTPAAKAFFTAPLAFLGGASYAQVLGANGGLAAGSYFAGYEGNSWGTSWQESTETQVNYDSKLVTLTVGGLYYSAKEIDSGLPGMAPNFGFTPAPTLLPLGNVQAAIAKTISIAAYAQGEFHVTDQLDIVAGARITRDKKEGSLTFGGTFVGDRNGSGGISGATVTPWEFKKSKPTFSLGVNYKPTSDMLLYAKYSTGFLSGGAVGPFTFQPETVKSPEAGIKSDWFDHKLRVNAALWQATYHNTQSSQSGTNVGQPQLGVVVISNGTLKAYGGELEVTAAPMEGLTLSGSLGYEHGKLENPNPVVAQGAPYLWAAAPKWTGNLTAQYQTQPVYKDAYLYFRADGNYTGKYRVLPNPLMATQIPLFAPYEFSPSRMIVNARVALRDIDVGPVKGEIGLWSKNLTNNKDAIYSFNFADFLVNSSFQPARTVGVDFIVTY